MIASAAVAPFAAYQFHQSQQYAVFANVLAIPICNFIVMPAALIAMLLMPLGLERFALMPMGYGIEAMKWCANWVAALPGAVGYVAAIPTVAFALMLAGGMWLALWKTRIRLLGFALALAGLAVAPWMARPDVIVAQNGRLVAVRDPSGKLAALPAKRAKFEIERWLEYDGDGRSAAEAQRSEAFTCDAVGCVARVKGATVSVAKAPAAVIDDCARADIFVLDMPRPKDCRQPRTVLDVFDIWRNGNAALFIDKPSPDAPPLIRVETVAASRGERPWSMPPDSRRPKASARLPNPVVITPPGAASPRAPTTPGPSEAKSASSQDPGEEPDGDASDAAAPDQ